MFENDNPIGYAVMAAFWVSLLLSGSWWPVTLVVWGLIWIYAK